MSNKGIMGLLCSKDLLHMFSSFSVYMFTGPVYCFCFWKHEKAGFLNYTSQSLPLHSHKALHLSPACLHLQRPLQHFLHAQRTSSLDEELASGRVVQNGFQSLGSIHPQSLGDGHSGAASRAFPQQCPPWYTALLICCNNAAWVGGMASIARPFLANNSCRASLISSLLLVRS